MNAPGWISGGTRRSGLRARRSRRLMRSKAAHARVQAAASVLGETGIKLGPMAARDAEVPQDAG